MAKQITDDVALAVKDFITEVTSFEEDTPQFDHIEKHILDTLKKSPTMYFISKQEIDRNMADMAAKFILHNFFPQAEALQNAYKSYVPENLPQSERVTRLNVIRLLMQLSDQPTKKFSENLQREFLSGNVETVEEEEQEEINWGEYLKEGIDTWRPNFDETTDDSDRSCSPEESFNETHHNGHNTQHLPVIADETDKVTVVDFRSNREELLATIQHTWYNQDRFYMPPASNWREANIGILWDKFLEEQAMGLIPIQRSSIISEYKVIREILWQMWSHHTSAVFELHINNMRPKSGVTISSIRAGAFENFLKQFIPYMEVLEFFRDFSKSLLLKNVESMDDIPCTYRSYNASLQNTLQPIYKKLSALEEEVRQQETTYTLLKLAYDLEELMKPVMLLKKIHDEVVLDFRENSKSRCVTMLLCRLQNSLRHTTTKLEQDLRLALFLDSLYYYLTLIDDWLMKNDMTDYTGEFIIINDNKSWYRNERITIRDQYESVADSEKWMLNFKLRDDLDEFCESNGLMRIIKESVLQIGRDLHLLRLLGKFPILKEKGTESIHEEFIRKCLEELEKFYKTKPPVSGSGDTCGTPSAISCLDKTTGTSPRAPCSSELTGGASSSPSCTCQFCFPGRKSSSPGHINEKKYKYPVVCTEDCKRPTEFDRLENLVDTSDGFLMLAFEDYLMVKPEEPEEQPEDTLFEKVSKLTTTLFPTTDFFERIFYELLEDRFAKTKPMVKNVLVDEYSLRKQFQFLRHVFLFQDDLIFPFYRKLIERANSTPEHPVNIISMTWLLQDVIMDMYPEFYKRCTVQANDYWRYGADPIAICSAVEVRFEIQWPLNIVVTESQMEAYQGVFRFIVQLKWALHTTNRLTFNDLEPKKTRRKDLPKAYQAFLMRLRRIRFLLSNLLTCIHHFVFSFVFAKCEETFESDFEKARDLSSIKLSHLLYINGIRVMLSDVSQEESDFPAFENLMECVKLLKMMWEDVELATNQRLEDCYKMYERCYEAIDPVVRPIDIYYY